MKSRTGSKGASRVIAAALVGTILSGMATSPALGQAAPSAQTPAAPSGPREELPAQGAPAAVSPGVQGTIQSVRVEGAQRLEPETVRSYAQLSPGQAYTAEVLDAALRRLFDTELFADVVIGGADTGNIVLNVRENPIINRIILEGNRRLKADKINPEIRLAPRQIFTRSKAQADVARILELYRRQGRYGASVEPKIVRLDQNRVDLVFEITEGPRSQVRQINIIGNEKYSDDRLRDEMATKQTGILSFLSSNDTYDPDRLAYDQQKLRQFYLTEGFADFRVVSAVAELTPDRRDFIITYVVEEGDRYKFGEVKIDSALRDFRPETLNAFLPMKAGDWFNAKQVEDTVTSLNETAGLFGYAFAEISPQYDRNREAKTMGITFQVGDAPRTYVERIDINGNTYTKDKVVRREFRLNEGDAFNSIRLKRSRDRIQGLGFFQEDLEIKQTQTAPDRVALNIDVEERSTGELQLSAGFSSLENFILNFSLTQRNWLGRGQLLRAGVNYSSYAKSIELGFTEPYLFDTTIGLGGQVYRRDLNSFNFVGDNDERETTYEQITTGGGLTLSVPITEYLVAAGRYTLNFDEVSLARNSFFSDTDGDGTTECDPLLAGRYLCDLLGDRTTSLVGYTLLFDNTDNRVRPTRGQRLVLNQDFAGLGGDVSYIRSSAEASKYWRLFGSGFIASVRAEAGYIHPLEDNPGPGRDAIRISDRLFGPAMRGFDIRGIGPRVVREFLETDATGAITGVSSTTDDSIGGRASYLVRGEIEIPLGAGARDLGLRPSVFVDVGSLFSITRPNLTEILPGDPRLTRQRFNADGTPVLDATGAPIFDQIGIPFRERFVGDSPSPRVSVGIGVNWNSPFGPFRIDLAKALISQDGDDEKLFSFNVGTAF